MFGLIALAETVLLVLVLRLPPQWTRTLQALVVGALIWDNAVIALGSAIGPGAALQALSVPRYVTHALLVPLLVLIAAGLTGVADLRPFILVTGLLISVGIYADIVTLALEPATYAGTLRYTNAASNGPPIPAIVVILILIAFGVLLLKRRRSPWLLTGALTMLIAAATGIPWLANLGELALAATVCVTAIQASPHRDLEPLPTNGRGRR
ncbi:hypothetical protein [Paractinoplanes atraurantiacus]|uniref:hypothetical protein n=1 Tax=Paractinoplanes atraurantiacus TaxID=1036182 RepID=UPI001177E670|nr:hypothetical protein [Actinoplanes atraurantiacus]